MKEALEGPNIEEWMKSLKNELESLKQHNVWDFVELPAQRKAIGSNWIFKVKTDAGGKIQGSFMCSRI